jgi:hypothetical protein
MITMSIVIKTRGLAYIISEDGEFLDWAIKRFSRRGSQERVIAFLLSLIHLGDIEAVLVNEIDKELDTTASKFSKSLEQSLSIENVMFHEVPTSILKESFGNQSRYKVAESLIQTMPQIAHLLPRRKRLWESEDASMLLFDAVAQAKALDMI